VLGPRPEGPAPAARRKPPQGVPAYLASLYDTPLLTREQEAHLFRKMNYLQYRASQLRDELDSDHPNTRLMDQIENLYEQAVATKNQIISANLRLVVSIAKRHVAPNGDFFELVSDGNMSLIRAVERFDFARGNRFSTYACWAIMKNFSRTIPDQYRHRERFRSGMGEFFGAMADDRTDQHQLEDAQAKRKNVVNDVLRRLDSREQEIITYRYGLERGREPLTLKQVGHLIGVTKERVRQIEARAIGKLRAASSNVRIEPAE
jgi:RNA polymerase primary sigma factor